MNDSATLQCLLDNEIEFSIESAAVGRVVASVGHRLDGPVQEEFKSVAEALSWMSLRGQEVLSQGAQAITTQRG